MRRAPEDNACAVFDSSDSSFTVFADKAGKYLDGQADGTKTYFSGLKSTSFSMGNYAPWSSVMPDVRTVRIANHVVPDSTAWWFQSAGSKTGSATLVGVENLDTSKVTDMSGMFYDSCFDSLDLGSLDTSNVKVFSHMFYLCQKVTSLDLRGFDTSKATDMGNMFRNCFSLKSLDISSFDTSNVTDFSSMFTMCRNLTTIYASDSFTMGKGQGYPFDYDYSLVGGNGTKFDSRHIDDSYARIDRDGAPGYFTEKTA